MGNGTRFYMDNENRYELSRRYWKWYVLSHGQLEMVRAFSGIMGNGTHFLGNNPKWYVRAFSGIMVNGVRFLGDNGKWFMLSQGKWKMVRAFSGILGNGTPFFRHDGNGKRYLISLG